MKRESRADSSGTPAASSDDPAAILSRIAGGDADAVADLHALARDRVYRSCRKILGDQADAEEVTVDVFLQVWRQAGRFDAARGRPSTWLLTIARSRALDRRRALRRRKSLENGLEAAGEPVCPGADPEAGLALAERALLLRSALARLKPLQRRAIELAFVEGLTGAEVAERLAAPLGTIKTRIRTGLLDLRRALSGAGIEPALRPAAS